MKRIALVLLVGCGGSGGPAADAAIDSIGTIDAALDAPPAGAFALTSPMLAAGAAFNAANTCNGANTSPQLAWTAGPAGTMSYAIIFTDKSNNLIHWVIYDIPASATGLPADVQKAYMPNNVAGAKQTLSYQAVRGYLGPCPPVLHTYEFVVYALDVATLPGVTMNSTRAQLAPVILDHDLGMAALSGTYQQP
ncbi:MAG: YbhB/YbcL family Raf kinase inhibitor-like protein [Myxococcota bacterium]|nr:YbhB/YbcL family Raf kinase inhibitor-like protein [Myxococcota bacterium]